VVNADEAQRVREIFGLFLDKGSVIATVQELNRRGWTPQGCPAKIHRRHGDGPFDRYCLRRLLTNHAYVGEVAFDGHLFPAEHEPIVDRESWEQIQTILAEADTPQHRRAWLLAGILRCAPCEADMSPVYGLRERQYLY